MNLKNPVYDKVWSIEEQQKCFDDYCKIKNLKEWREFVKKNDSRLFLQVTSQYPVNFSEVDHSPINLDKFTFAKIAEVEKLDLKHLRSYVLKKFENAFSRNIVPTINTIKVDKNNLGVIYKWADIFELDNRDMQIRYALPGSLHPVHSDCLEHIWGFDESLDDKKFHHITKSPDGYHAIRLLIALNDWVPGQVVGFENDIWEYKTGDVIAFEWSNTRHYTSNTSWTPRIVLRITGITKNPNHWVFQNINNKKIRTL